MNRILCMYFSPFHTLTRVRLGNSSAGMEAKVATSVGQARRVSNLN